MFLVAFALVFAGCNPAKKTTAGRPPGKPGTVRPTDRPDTRSEPMDTIRWTTAPNAKPPIANAPATPAEAPGAAQTYRLALLLPFLTDQADPGGLTVPEKSSLALQFYGGVSLALQKLSEEGINLAVEVFDTQVSDADFQRLLGNPRLGKAQVMIGPVRPSHVALLAERIRQTRQILISPESPTMNLTSRNPDFIQINPSLRAHCTAITRHILRRHSPESVTLVCKEKEADRLPFFQQANSPGNKPFAQILVPDAATTFDNIDLSRYFKPGRTAVFVLPTWASQDFVMAFLRKLSAGKGANTVEVYGMPQWKNFENIEPEYFATLNVHIIAASFVNRDTEEARAFRYAFYAAYGTVPDDNAYNGYDTMLFTGQMLRRYGLSFPQRLPAERPFDGLRGRYQFAKAYSDNPPDAANDQLEQYDYLENTFVHILRFQNYRFEPVD
ncbi:MAG: amino acid ABC transporter substrate-binding protein [Lewinellaceae bacterium]|nr:amino acid ABC transporter substrate-binding protein [Lewinellaceae bacterium]